MIQPNAGEAVESKQQAKHNIRPVRWDEAEWRWLATVAKSVGLSRSEFVRRSAMEAAKAAVALVPGYSVGGASATPQNTRPTENGLGLRQQAEAVFGGEGSRTELAPEGITRPNPEDLGRQGGGGPTNGATTKARKAKLARS